MTDITERLERTAAYLAILGRASGDTRWEAAQLMREAKAEIEGLRLEHAHACQEIAVAVAENGKGTTLIEEFAALREIVRRHGGLNHHLGDANDMAGDS